METNKTKSDNSKTTTDYPLHSIYFYPTESCNLRCIHCWLHPLHAPDDHFYQVQNRGNVTVETMDKVVREALPLGLGHVKLTGGEPFLNPAFFDYMDCFSKYGLSLSIETNGTLITDKVAKKLKTYNLRQISTSLDGSNARVHETIRRVKGSFKQALDGIRSLIKNDIYPQVIFCLQQLNAHDLDDTIRLAHRMKIRSFEINPVVMTATNTSSGNRCQSLPTEELLRLEKLIEGEYTDRFPRMHINLYIPPALKGIKELARHALCTCNIFNICGILSNGDVSVCGIGRRNKELVMGNVKKEGIARIWREGRIFKDIRKKIPHQMQGICGKCIFKQHCLGFCRADALCSGQSLLDPNDFCQAVYQKGMFPVSRTLNP